MNDEEQATAVVFTGAPAPTLPKPTLFDWIAYYAWNLYRAPLVWSRKREILKIAEQIQAALREDLFPALEVNRSCGGCRDAIRLLRHQVFTSQIAFGLKHLRCDDHPEPFVAFYNAQSPRFQSSERIASWINGFYK